MTTRENSTNNQEHKQSFMSRHWVTMIVLSVVAFYLITEHQAHLFGALPWLILLACPFIHIFMHRGHGGHARKHNHIGDKDGQP